MTPDVTLCTGKTCTRGNLTRPGTLLCSGCTTRLERQLAEWNAMLGLVHTLHNGRQTPRRSDRPGSDIPAPLSTQALNLLLEAPAILGSWVLMVCEERNLRGPDDPTRHPAWLQGQLSWIVEQHWVDDFAAEVDEQAREMAGLVRISEHRNRLEPPCPSCGAHELGRWDGQGHVDCASCGRRWPEDQYPWMVRLALDESGGCLSATQGAHRLGLSVVAFYQLVHRGRVRKLGTVDGQARYSTSDVEALLEEDVA